MGVAPYGTGPMRAWGDACAEPNPKPRRSRAPPVPPGPPGNAWKEESTPRSRVAGTDCPHAKLSASRSTTCTTWLRRIAGICVRRSATYDAYSDDSSSGGRREISRASDPTGRDAPFGSRSRRNPRNLGRALGRPGPPGGFDAHPSRAVSVPAGVVMPAAIPSATPEGVTLAPAARASGERWFPAYSPASS